METLTFVWDAKLPLSDASDEDLEEVILVDGLMSCEEARTNEAVKNSSVAACLDSGPNDLMLGTSPQMDCLESKEDTAVLQNRALGTEVIAAKGNTNEADGILTDDDMGFVNEIFLQDGIVSNEKLNQNSVGTLSAADATDSEQESNRKLSALERADAPDCFVGLSNPLSQQQGHRPYSEEEFDSKLSDDTRAAPSAEGFFLEDQTSQKRSPQALTSPPATVATNANELLSRLSIEPLPCGIHFSSSEPCPQQSKHSSFSASPNETLGVGTAPKQDPPSTYRPTVMVQQSATANSQPSPKPASRNRKVSMTGTRKSSRSSKYSPPKVSESFHFASLHPYHPTRDEMQDARTKKNRRDLHAWYSKLNELKAHMDIEGSCNVPQKKELGRWVNKQRENKKFLDEGMKSNMTRRKIELLEEIGLTWSEKRIVGETAWDKSFKGYQEFRELYECDVPTRPTKPTNAAFRKGPVPTEEKLAEYKRLGRWVTTQRDDYKKLKNGEDSDMNPDRFQRLSEIDFVFEKLSRRGSVGSKTMQLEESADTKKDEGKGEGLTDMKTCGAEAVQEYDDVTGFMETVADLDEFMMGVALPTLPDALPEDDTVRQATDEISIFNAEDNVDEPDNTTRAAV